MRHGLIVLFFLFWFGQIGMFLVCRSKLAQRLGLDHLAPHDLRRTCAKLCHVKGGELEQIQFLLGHVSVQTTERYIGCKQRLKVAVNDRLGIEPKCELFGTQLGA